MLPIRRSGRIFSFADFAFDAAVLVDMRATTPAGATMGKGLARGHQRHRRHGEDDVHLKITLPVSCAGQAADGTLARSFTSRI